MGPRLQGEASPDGRLTLALWGLGPLGRIAFEGWKGPYLYAPNRLTCAQGGFHAAQSRPALLLEKTRLTRFTTAGKGVVLFEPRGDDLVVAAGADRREAEAALGLTAAEIQAEAEAHVRRCDLWPDPDPLMRSLVLQGAHAALAAVRRDAAGRFAGLAAGLAYSAPARCYYRDSYWTLPMLRRLDPEAAAATVQMLAGGLRPDGEAPSAVLAPGAAWPGQCDPAIHHRPGEWWSDHFDSPLYAVLMLAEAPEVDAGRPKLRAVLDRYEALCPPGSALPRKPRHDRDWADNVFRSGRVAYDLGLWIGALDAIAACDPASAERARHLARRARVEIEELWRPGGWYADYDGEDHLALDTLTLLRFDAVPEARARQLLVTMSKRLERPWGVACCDPPYRRRSDLRAKSAFPGRYHNGGDWPWLDGLFAGELLRRGLPGWRHPLTRWWEMALDQGWAGAIEHHSPVFGRGSLLQAWSSLPAAVALEFLATDEVAGARDA